MTDTIRDLMDQLDSFAKEASALEGIDSMPGSEHDKPIPSGSTNPDPKVKDDTIDNQEHKSTSGAEPGSDFPANNANEYKSDEAALTADKKPLDTADANAKEAAAAKANDIVSTILKAKQAQSEKKAATAEPKAATAEPKPATSEKKAAPDANTITLDMAMMAKIAAITLADEEGQLAVQAALTKRAGAEFANEVLDILEKRAAEEQARYEFEKGAQDAEAMIGDMQEAQGAADAEQAIGDLAGAQGAAGAEEALGGGEGEGGEMSEDEAAEAIDDYSADEIIEAVQELAEEGQIPEDQAQAVIESISEGAGEEGSEEDISEEDLAEAIVQAVESGELSEEDAQALVQGIAEGDAGDAEADQQLAQDVAGAGAAGGEAAGGEAAGGEDPAAAEAAAAAEAEKAAAVKRASFKQQLVKVLKGNK